MELSRLFRPVRGIRNLALTLLYVLSMARCTRTPRASRPQNNGLTCCSDSTFELENKNSTLLKEVRHATIVAPRRKLKSVRYSRKQQLPRSAGEISQTKRQYTTSIPQCRQEAFGSLQTEKGGGSQRWIRGCVQDEEVGRDWTRSGLQWQNNVILVHIAQELLSEIS